MESAIRTTDRGVAAAVLLSSLLLAAVPAAAATFAPRSGALPVAVSPGSTDSVTAAPGSCPTFSWSGVTGAPGYELAVVRLGEAPEAPALRATVPGGATSWTPAGDRCLAPGRYGWTLRVTGDPPGEWAAGRAFEVRAAPSAEEVARAIDVLERYRKQIGGAAQLAGTSTAAGSRSTAAKTPAGRSAPAVPRGTSSAAILGDQTATSGAGYGVEGQSASPAGAGVSAANGAGGADLRLDGAADGQADTLLRQSGLDRPSGTTQGFSLGNSSGGGFHLDVSGTVNASSFAGDGSALTGVDADLLDGMDSSAFLTAGTDNWVDITGDAMTGDLSTTGDFLWNSPRTFYLTIPGSSFAPAVNTDAWHYNGIFNYIAVNDFTFPEVTVEFNASVNLPDGAVIQTISLLAYDNDATADATFELSVYRRELTATSVEGIAAGGGPVILTTTGDSTAIQSVTVGTVPSRAVVDNVGYTYEMRGTLILTSPSNDLRFYGGRIEYTLAGPAN